MGLVPATLELALGLSPAVERSLPELVARVADEARRLGYPLAPRNGHAYVPRGDRRAARALGLP